MASDDREAAGQERLQEASQNRFRLSEGEKERRLQTVRGALARNTPHTPNTGARAGRPPGTSTLAALCFVLGLGALLFAFFLWLGSPAVRQAGGQIEITIPAAPDGHHYIDGRINGRPVSFLIDSGASVVSVSQSLADQLDLGPGRSATFMTAAGPAAGRMVASQQVSAGGIGPLPLSVGVMPGSQPMALLGQNFLRHVEVVQANRRLILRGPGQAPAVSPARAQSAWVALAGVALLAIGLVLRHRAA